MVEGIKEYGIPDLSSSKEIDNTGLFRQPRFILGVGKVFIAVHIIC